jgi:hypothetical protein
MVKNVGMMCFDITSNEIVYPFANKLWGARVVGQGLFKVDDQPLVPREKLIVEFSHQKRLLQEEKSVQLLLYDQLVTERLRG